MFNEALSFYQEGEPARAAALFASLADATPDNADTQRLLGLALVRSDRAAEALAPLARARRLVPDNPLAYLHYGIGLLEAGRPARAMAMLRRATILQPNDPVPWVHLSAAILAVGRPPAARAAARRAVQLAPRLGEAYCALGRAERAAGDLGNAREAFLTAAQLAPALADAWVDLGATCLRLGQIEQATTAMQRALEVTPGHAAAEANLGALLMIQGDYVVGKERLRALVDRAPRSIAGRLNLANAMLLDGEATDALVLLQGTPPSGREGAHWRAHRALALLMLWRNEEARAEVDAIPQPYGEVEILVVWRRVVLAERAGDLETACRLAERVNELASREDAALLEHRILAHFDLAAFQSRRGKPDAAMHHWSAAHRLLSRVQPFSRTGFTSFVNTSIEAYDRRRLEDGPRADQTDETPVFIVGMPRSGTTLVEQILASHRDVHGAGERAALHKIASELGGPAIQESSIRTLAGVEADILTKASGAYLSALRAEAAGQRFIVDKMPGNALILGFLATLLPGARIIHCRRDPRDIGLSIFQLRFFGYHPYAHDLADLGWYLSEHDRLMRHWKRALPNPLLEIDLSDWVEDFPGTLSRVLAFLDLPHDPACERFYEHRRMVRTASATQVHQPINARGIGRWRAYEQFLGPMLNELSRETV